MYNFTKSPNFQKNPTIKNPKPFIPNPPSLTPTTNITTLNPYQLNYHISHSLSLSQTKLHHIIAFFSTRSINSTQYAQTRELNRLSSSNEHTNWSVTTTRLLNTRVRVRMNFFPKKKMHRNVGIARNQKKNRELNWVVSPASHDTQRSCPKKK